jgi:hypothetical protein
MAYLEDNRLYGDPKSRLLVRVMTVMAIICLIAVALEGTFLILFAFMQYGWH